MNSILLFSRDEATLYERVSVRPSVRWSVRPSVPRSVTLSLFGLLGATYGRVSGLVQQGEPTDKLRNRLTDRPTKL